MAQEKKHFRFDDEETMEHKEQELKKKEKVIPPVVEKTKLQKKKESANGKVVKKKKLKIRVWHIILALVLIVGGIFAAYVVNATNNDGPVYGDRCKGLLALDDARFQEVITAVKTAETRINSMTIKKDCRTIHISIDFNEAPTVDEAKQIAENALHTLDDLIGHTKEEGAAYSQLLGQANGVGQYNVSFRLTKAGDPSFPMFGTKHPKSDAIEFTTATPKDESTTNRVLEAEKARQEEQSTAPAEE